MNHLRSFCILVLLVAGSAGTLLASGKLGLGVVVGQPTGLAWNYALDTRNAIDGGIGFSPNGDSRLYADYLWKSYPFNSVGWSLHYGPGLVFGWESDRGEADENDAFLFPDDDLRFAIRGIIGVSYNIQRSPVDLFLDAGPLFIISPAASTDFDLGFGVRVYP
ncbi:MAG TPA: hypothetical protein VLY03_12285 [Bacteroidota bacterium]|nr:hypothetical protein [Bacteroidota bacterium]